MLRLLLLFLLAVHSSVASAEKLSVIKNLRSWQAPDHTRIVFDLSDQVKHSIFSLDNPHRLVLDIENSRLLKNGIIDADLNQPITKIRHGKHDNKMRLVFDLSRKVQARSFLLEPNESYGYRLIVDMYGSSNNKAGSGSEDKASIESKMADPNRDIVVVIDPGHGGEDPGAVGLSGVLEKDIVLNYSKELKKKLNANKGITAKLTRETDYFIFLPDRNKIAHKHRADLFISVHANSLDNSTSTRGFIVFALSDKAATSEIALTLAKSENRSDEIGGTDNLSLSGKSRDLRKVLIDLSMTSSINHSILVGKEILKSVSPHAKLHTSHVEQAGFTVLKSTDIPAVLLELGFLSNKEEEKLLIEPWYRKKMVNSISQGVVNYLNMYPPHGTLFASRKSKGRSVYVVKSRDTLSDIAMQNNVDIEQLLRINNMKSDTIFVGQKLYLYDVKTAVVANDKRSDIYVVRSGDTLGEIAERFNINIRKLRELNNIKKESFIRLGQTIRLRKKD